MCPTCRREHYFGLLCGDFNSSKLTAVIFTYIQVDIWWCRKKIIALKSKTSIIAYLCFYGILMLFFFCLMLVSWSITLWFPSFLRPESKFWKSTQKAGFQNWMMILYLNSRKNVLVSIAFIIYLCSVIVKKRAKILCKRNLQVLIAALVKYI